ncbi:hypothetical protein GA0115250_102721 [Streptomyces sp. BvitLS-983]|nr:hypothetical protein GA0115250_102721 [Streptomyces sp. BvitLS-983]
MLHDHWKAYRSEASAHPSTSLLSCFSLPGRVYGSGERVGASGSVTVPASRAAAAVTTLKADPGG